MKATIKFNGQEKEVELTDEQVRELGLSNVWKPRIKEEYYFLYSTGKVESAIFGSDEVSKGRYDIGNCYRKQEKAEFEQICQLYLTKYKRWLDEHNEPIDWNNSEQRKCYAYYDYYRCCMGYSCTFSYKKQGSLYATSEQIIIAFIAEIGEENFKKYILRVKED